MSIKILFQKKYTVVLFYFSIIAMAYSQSKTDCTTIFVCISKENYAQLFQNSFVKDTLFLCKENSTTTTTDSYTGKYLLGEFGTIEFIQPSENINFGDKLNDIGIEFKTRRKGDLVQLKNKATPNKCVIEDISINESDKTYPWYSEFKLVKHPTNFEVSILEYSPNYLEELGFSKEQLNEEISPSTYNQIVYQGKAYPRKFKSFKSVSIEVNSEGKKYLKQMAKNYKFNFNENFVMCNDFIIYYKLNRKIKKTILKNIEINLTESLINKEIAISESIAISITNNNAKIIFKN
jgi:hypothetical protein